SLPCIRRTLPLSLICSSSYLDRKIRTSKLAQLTPYAIVRSHNFYFPVLAQSQHTLGAELDTDAATLAPFLVDLDLVPHAFHLHSLGSNKKLPRQQLPLPAAQHGQDFVLNLNKTFSYVAQSYPHPR
ncbi:MAG: hypothetical protein PWP58_1745, partial [Bacillota bacterium]|nr:hypothetical protein [Bacillota bacterium]